MTEMALVTYSEIGLKSEPVRRNMEIMLTENLRYALMRSGLAGAKIRRVRGRIIIEEVNGEKAATVASRVFGVASSMPAYEISVSLSEIVKASADLADTALEEGETFAVRARRVGTHPYASNDIEKEVGSEVLRRFSGKNIRVNLDAPDKVIYIEAREKVAYIYTKKFYGPGGLPLGSQGKVVSLLSGGVDSATASWLIMKRGAFVFPLCCDTSPYCDKFCIERTINVAKFLREFATVADYRLSVVPYGNILTEFIEKCPRNLTCVLCKRGMYRIACRFAEMKNAKAIVTGESLGQVASQTLMNLTVLDEASNIPVFRPLIGMDKNEIERLAERIGVRELAAIKVKRCEAAPLKPTTQAKILDVKKAEENVDINGLISKAFEKIEEIIL
ncbi:MAG TPA: tRNA uracil 4-sulfurtransferase ThiI [archaeon]|nr:tRNA uracil 4-sulfurtransferase ThiI [archaeon]